MCNPKNFTMAPEAEAAFVTMKQYLSNATKMSHLSTSPEAQIVLKSDVSQLTVGGVLQRIINRKTQLVTLTLRKLTPPKTR